MKINHFWRVLCGVALLGGSMGIYSCGSGGGGGTDEESDFVVSDLYGKPWYYNVWLNKPDEFNAYDGLEVYLFDHDGTLRFQEFSGRRDSVIGSWKMIDNELILRDKRKGENNEQSWYIVGPSTRNYLRMKTEAGTRELYAQVDALEDLYADASIVNEYYLVQGEGIKEGYRYEFELKGSNIDEKSVFVLLSGGTKYPLVKYPDGVYRLGEEDAAKHLETYEPHKERVRFVVGFKNVSEMKLDEDKVKLDETIYEGVLEKLDPQFVTITHGSGSQEIEVNWKPLEDEDVFYQVQVLDENKNEVEPLFISKRQKAGSARLVINPTIDNELNRLGDYPVGSMFYVKVVAFRYEPGIDPENTRERNENIQAKTQYIKSGGEW